MVEHHGLLTEKRLVPLRLIYGSYPEVVTHSGEEKDVVRLSSFSRNARNELKNSRKIYFYDNSIRNAILANFSPMLTRMQTLP